MSKSIPPTIASLIQEKVSNKHVKSPGAQPLMLQDTHKHPPSQTSVGGHADTTMRLETRVEGLGTERTQESSGNKAPPTLAYVIPAKKYPTDTAGTTTLGQQPLMPSDTHKHEGPPKDVEMEDTKVTTTTTAVKVVQDTTKEDQAMADYMLARAEQQEAAKKAAQEEAQKRVQMEQKAARDAAQKIAQDAAQKAAQDAAKAAQEAAKEKERIALREKERKAEEDKITQEEEKKKAAEELALRTKIMEEETRQRKEWMEKLKRLDEAKTRITPTTTTTTSSTTSTPTQSQPDYKEDEDGTITYFKGKGDKRWHQTGFCVRCKREIRSGEVRFFNKHQQIHTRCGTCPTCKESLAEADLEMGTLRVWCNCGRAVDFFHQC